MDFDGAVLAHRNWKMKLKSYLSKPDHSLDASVVAADNRCELGQWLHGEGWQYSNLPEYPKLVSDHARFHKAAGAIVEKANHGQSVVEETVLGANTEFTNASTDVVLSLMAMKKKCDLRIVGVRSPVHSQPGQ
jgi:methyl-accepting chemotaxis protein